MKSPRETFTIGLFGFDLTKLKAYQDADIIHIHWLNEGFINLKSLSKVKKPLIWTMRDMWAFTGGFIIQWILNIMRTIKFLIF